MEEESLIRKIYLDQIKNKIAHNSNYKLLEESFTVQDHKFVYIDAVLLVNDNPLAIFEFISSISTIIKQEALNIYERLGTDCLFFIITDGTKSKIYQTNKWTVKNVDSIDELWEILVAKLSEDQVEEFRIKIVDEIKKEVYTFKKELKDIRNSLQSNKFESKFQNILNALSRFENGFSDNLKYDVDGRFFYITKDLRKLNELENQFFKTIIEGVPRGTEIYRYTTLDSVFKTIEGKTLRLSGIVGMNDISEIGYVDGYLDKKFKPMATDDHVNSVNKKYIMCCSTLEDELMQWRLYGDDCKGACLVFEVNGENEIPGLLLRKVNYGININGENYHPELEFLFRVKNRLRKKLKIDFQFKTLSLWRHFFKSYEYEPEKEVRLLLIGNESDEIKGENFLNGTGIPIEIKWNLTNSHQILAPFIILNIDDNRLICKLKRVILGAKCPELGVNIKQFNLLTRKKGLVDIQVVPSRIINYR